MSANTCTCKPVVKQISSQDHTPCQWVFGTTSTGTTFLGTGAWNLVWERCIKLFHYVATYIKCTTFVPAAYSHWWHSVLVLIVEDIFCNIPSILIRSPASNSPRAVHSSLRLPCFGEQPKSATDIELITTALVQCAYPRTTWSSAAQESSNPS